MLSEIIYTTKDLHSTVWNVAGAFCVVYFVIRLLKWFFQGK